VAGPYRQQEENSGRNRIRHTDTPPQNLNPSEQTPQVERIHENIFGIHIYYIYSKAIILYLFVLPPDVFIRVLELGAMSPLYNESYMYVLRCVSGDDKRGINNTTRGSIYIELQTYTYRPKPRPDEEG